MADVCALTNALLAVIHWWIEPPSVSVLHYSTDNFSEDRGGMGIKCGGTGGISMNRETRAKLYNEDRWEWLPVRVGGLVYDE